MLRGGTFFTLSHSAPPTAGRHWTVSRTTIVVQREFGLVSLIPVTSLNRFSGQLAQPVTRASPTTANATRTVCFIPFLLPRKSFCWRDRARTVDVDGAWCNCKQRKSGRDAARYPPRGGS